MEGVSGGSEIGAGSGCSDLKNWLLHFGPVYCYYYYMMRISIIGNARIISMSDSSLFDNQTIFVQEDDEMYKNLLRLIVVTFLVLLLAIGSTSLASAGKPEQTLRAGLRSSDYGISPFPSPTWWVNSIKSMASRFLELDRLQHPGGD